MFEILAEPAPEAVERFLTGWYGPRTLEAALPEPGGSTAMPAPLRRFYDLVRRWPDAIVQNVVLAPPELPDLRKEAWAETRIDDGKLTFYVENQGVCKWATSPEEVDEARVWIRGSTLGREMGTWEPEEPPLSAFLVELLVFEAVMGATHGASVAWLDRPTLARVVEPLHRLPFGAGGGRATRPSSMPETASWHSPDRTLVLTRRSGPRSSSASPWAPSMGMRSCIWNPSPSRPGSGSRAARDRRPSSWLDPVDLALAEHHSSGSRGALVATSVTRGPCARGRRRGPRATDR
jgi:hypothetical protein